MRRFKSALLGLAIALSMGASLPRTLPVSAPPLPPPPFDGRLSVTTYNVHGLPWPIAWGRSAQLAHIATTLRGLREQGRNPHIVVLQEAFTQEAQSIGQAAGYRYVINGATADMPNFAAPTGADMRFAANGSWYKGEGLGKYVGSGLQILSDYPIVGVRRMAYPAFACAGYDCLANKGAVMASVQLPDRPDPIDIVTTHLNSRHASKVSDARSLDAYRRQLGYLTRFIHTTHDPARALIVAGDFNVGKALERRAMLMADAHRLWSPNAVRDAYGAAANTGLSLSGDAISARRRAKDWEFFASGRKTRIALQKIEVPFGHAPDGSMSSDHIGYTVVFTVARAATGPTNSARSTV